MLCFFLSFFLSFFRLIVAALAFLHIKHTLLIGLSLFVSPVTMDIACRDFALLRMVDEAQSHSKEIELPTQNTRLAANDLYAEMQGYIYTDVRVKGPHLNVKRDGSKITEAKLAPTQGSLSWVRCCDKTKDKDLLKKADRFIGKLLTDKGIMEEAKSQIEETITRFEQDAKSGSKGDKDIATRNLPTWRIMLKNVETLLNE